MEKYFHDADAAAFVKSFVQRLPTTDTGQPFSLYPWQDDLIEQFYGDMEWDEESGEAVRRYQYCYLEIPKKNGKSELSAALALYHLFGDGERNAEVYLCAADKENAAIVFDDAVFMANSAPWTAKMIARGELKIIESQRRILYRQMKREKNGGSHWVTISGLCFVRIKVMRLFVIHYRRMRLIFLHQSISSIFQVRKSCCGNSSKSIGC